MNRRDTVLTLLALGAAPHFAFAQQSGKVWRVGHLSPQSGPDATVEAFREQLRSFGYVEGRNLLFEFRWAAGKNERIPELAAELVQLKVDLIVTRTTFVAVAAKRATSTIPIVMASAADPVGAGVVASLAHPGGNVTGVTHNTTEVDGKRLQLLHEVVPKATRIATLVWEKAPLKPLFLEQIRAAAQKMGIAIVIQEVGTSEALAGAFNVMKRERAQGLIVPSSPFHNNNRKRIAELAAQHRLPSMFDGRAFVDEGGLMSYGPSGVEMSRRAAFYVDRIFKGAKPADLPVEQPTKFELVINMKTAKTLGLTIPQSVLARADEVIR